jgi:hypothetical protein
MKFGIGFANSHSAIRACWRIWRSPPSDAVLNRCVECGF